MDGESTIYRNPVRLPQAVALDRAQEGMLAAYFRVLDTYGAGSPQFKDQERLYWTGLAAVADGRAEMGVNPAFHRKWASELREKAAKAA